MRIACEQARGPDNVRRTRMLVTRNTLPQLRSTCLVSIQQQLRGISRWAPSENTLHIRVGDIESDWLLIPLDTPENIDRLLSLELTYAWASEARELDPELVKFMLSRCGRYPALSLGGPTRYGLIAESNSFRIDSPWFDLLEQNLPPNWEYFVQPSALSPQADWLQYLPPSYYTDLIQSNTPEWVAQYIENEYGESLDGQAVYKHSFSNRHIAENALIPYPGSPLLVGMDFARWPAAVICQIDARGRFLIFAEVQRENCGVEKFVLENLLPLLSSERFGRCPRFIIGDPSGAQRSQIGEESVFNALTRIGFAAYPAVTNQIEARIRAVEKFLIQNRGDTPALLIDPSCHVLIEGFKWRYQFIKKKSGMLEAKPDKIRPWADVHDALQYACLGTAQSTMTRAMVNLRSAQGNSAPAPSAAGWT
jgi:hypothetical protein